MADLTTSHSTIVVETSSTETAGNPVYAPVTTKVSDVLDRGVLLLPTGEELRLRGIAIPSTTDKNEVNRLYAKEAIQVLRNLTQGKDLYVLLDTPLRDGSGHLLGTIVLADGTELNRRLISLGYGTVHKEDFGPDVDFSDLEIAQTEARDKRLGIWSANF
jgi:endonuclease YncB( thermonuclease family)